MRRGALFCFILAVAVMAVYWPVKTFPFIDFDDPQFIENNTQIQSGLNWDTVVYAFTTPVVGNWHPLTTLSHAMDCQLFGLRAGLHHVTSVVIHAVNAMLLFLLLFRLRPLQLGTSCPEDSIFSAPRLAWFCFFVAGVFALHPLRVESVAWVAERKDVLSGMFFLLTLWFYLGYARLVLSSSATKQIHRSYFAALAFFALGLMSKPMLVTVPFVLLLLDFWPLHRLTLDLRRAITEKVPFFLLAGASSILTLRLQQSGMASQAKLGITERIANALLSYGAYLKKFFWPDDLAVFYPHRFLITGESSALGWVWVSALILLILTTLSLGCGKSKPYLSVGWFWFLGMMVPVIGLVQVGAQSMADRYTYLPTIGIAIAVACLLSDFIRGKHLDRICAISCVVLLGSLAIATRFQLRYWSGTVPLFAHTLMVTGKNPNAEFALAVGLEKEGNLEAAVSHYLNVLSSDPYYIEAHYNLGRLFVTQQKWALAREHLETALAQKPDHHDARAYLAAALAGSADYSHAKSLYLEVLQAQPNSPGVLNNLAWLLATSPDNSVRNGPLAVTYAARACELTRRTNSVFIGTLAAAHAENGDFSSAQLEAQHAIKLSELEGNMVIANKNRELMLLYKQGKPIRE